MKMLHTCIRVFDLDASIKFYKMLGLNEARRLDYSSDGFILVYLSDEEQTFELELTYNVDAKPYTHGTGYGHLALGSLDFEALYQKHIELGYEVSELKGLPGEEPALYFITDPDGYKIEIMKLDKEEV